MNEELKYNANFKNLVDSIVYPKDVYLINQGFKKDIVEVILKNLVVGLTIKDCCDLVGVLYVNLNSWVKDDIGGIEAAITSAIARNKQYHVSNIYNAKDALKMKGSQFWLERKHKREFSKEVTLNIQGAYLEGVQKLFKEFLLEYVKDPDELTLKSEMIADRLKEIGENSVSETMLNMKGK